MLTPRFVKGIGDPEDLTGAVVLLCSGAGKFITGTDIKIDGSLLCLEIGEWQLTLGIRGIHNVLSWTRGRWGLNFGDPNQSWSERGGSLP